MALPARTQPLRNVGFRLSAEGTARILNFLLSVIGARILGAARWGIYWTGFSWASVAVLATDLGGHLTLSRAVARVPGNARAALGISLSLKLVLSAAVFAVWALVGGFPGLPLSLQATLLGAALCLSFIEWLGFHLRGFGRVPAESLLLAADCAAAFGAGVFALFRGCGPLGLAVSQLAAHGAVLAAAAGILSRHPAFRPRLPSMARVRGFLRESAPTGLYLFASLGSWRLGIMWLAATPAFGAAAAGLFAATHRILEAARFFPAAAAAALFPSFARPKPEEHPRRVLLAALPPVIIGTMLVSLPSFSGGVVRLLFGPAFVTAGPLLSVLAWAFPFMTVNWVLSHWLIARGREKANASLAVLQFIVHATSLFLLVPSHGALGAASSLVISEASFSVSAFVFLLFR